MVPTTFTNWFPSKIGVADSIIPDPDVALGCEARGYVEGGCICQEEDPDNCCRGESAFSLREGTAEVISIVRGR